jgi:ABC-2 type transport system permease protein
MSPREQWIAFVTIVAKEIKRFTRIWPQTLLPPAITIALYFIIFGTLIGPRIGTMSGFRYIEFVVPGLIMMSIITNSYGNVVSSFFGAKFQRSIEEVLVSPVPSHVLLFGYVIGGVIRGLAVGSIVTCLSLFFTDLHIHNATVTVVIVFFTSVLFALTGFINAMYANSFDDISIIPVFVLTPLTYLGGVFYSIEMLPDFWQRISMINPILYMVNAFRYGLLGITDININLSFFMVISFCVVLFSYSLYLLDKGKRLRT